MKWVLYPPYLGSSSPLLSHPGRAWTVVEPGLLGPTVGQIVSWMTHQEGGMEQRFRWETAEGIKGAIAPCWGRMMEGAKARYIHGENQHKKVTLASSGCCMQNTQTRKRLGPFRAHGPQRKWNTLKPLSVSPPLQQGVQHLGSPVNKHHPRTFLSCRCGIQVMHSKWCAEESKTPCTFVVFCSAN